MDDKQVDERLEAIIRLFLNFNGRDLFINNYTEMLAKRLMDVTSVSNDAEQLMVKKLQVQCGGNTVAKIKTMFGDINQSKMYVENYRKAKHEGAKQVKNIEFNIQVLTSGSWPFHDAPALHLPP